MSSEAPLSQFPVIPAHCVSALSLSILSLFKLISIHGTKLERDAASLV
jgi:hypothetical protein